MSIKNGDPAQKNYDFLHDLCQKKIKILRFGNLRAVTRSHKIFSTEFTSPFNLPTIFLPKKMT